MIDLLLFILLFPAIIVWAVYRMLADLADLFGWLLGPAVLSLYAGGLLFVVGPAAPDAMFESIFQLGAEAVVFGVHLPVVLLVAGVVMLAIGAATRRKATAN